MVAVTEIFPYRVPSQPQQKLMESVIQDYDKYDVFVINAPVAFGKSGVSKAIMNLANIKRHTANWIVPTNQLVEQAIEEFDIPTIKRKAEYSSAAQYAAAKEAIKTGDQSVMNYWSLLANRCYKHTLIVDEAHSMVGMLQDFEGAKYWDTEPDFPKHLRTASDAIIWMAQRYDDPRAEKMLATMERHPDLFTVSYEWGMYRNQLRQCLRVYPLSPRNNRPILWPPSRTRKIFLLSATISEQEVLELGLSDRRVKVYHADSTIPPQNRPVIYEPVGSMSHGKVNKSMDRLCDYILDKLENEKGKGFIHATYGMAGSIRAKIGKHPRLMYHTKNTKQHSFSTWLKSDNGVFIGSGMTEGINLKGELASWQIITKCPFPSLVDPAIKAKKELDERWYVWVTIREMLQAYGRVCRSPDDFGKTMVVDAAFKMLYSKHKDLFPKWFREALI